LRAAENAFTSRDVQGTEPGRLTLARFYRLTFRPLESCNHFPSSLESIESVRFVLRDCHIYAEAATQLWLNDYPEQTYKPHLLEARHLLETAIAAGYRNARMLTDLAFIAAILDGAPAGELVLHGIRAGSAIDWVEVSSIAARVDSVDLVTQGFALGMDQSAIWTRLGTFAYIFLADDELAEILYRAAIQLGPHDAIALTNLARHLIQKGDEKSLSEAERLLDKAQNFADRRFFWWRQARTLLAEKRGSLTTAKSKPPSSKTSSSIREFRSAFQRLESMENAQQRGLELERLVFDICKITFGIAAPSYSIKRDGGGVIRQIDGYFKTAADRYRVESKWLTEQAGQNEIAIFANKLDVVGVSGLFISMSGFKETAVAEARELRKNRAIILMDGDEARAVFNGYITFDELLRRKRQHFDQLSNPYYRVLPRREI
jgi:hypothetical protein